MPHESVRTILVNVLGMRRVAARLVPAPSYTSTLVCEFLTRNSTNVIDQALYSPDMCDFFLFLKFKLSFCGRHFEFIKASQNKIRRRS